MFGKLARQRESKVEKGRSTPDHVYIRLSIPPKYAASQAS
jgi:hypothetical protein